MKTEHVPAEVFHVMDFVHEELEARGWNLWQLAIRMGGDVQVNYLALEMLDARIPDVLIGEDMAALIVKAFGTGAELWLNLDETWRTEQARLKNLPLPRFELTG